jgi:L-ascorbate metabolism protein UlaG (beta-lactamase superfamily)
MPRGVQLPPVLVRWLGHSIFQITTPSNVVYVDLKKYGKVVETSEKADVILVTHNHSDHCSPQKIERLCKKDTVIVAPKNCASRLKGEVRALQPGEKTVIGDVTIEAVEAYNVRRFKAPGKPWHPRGYGVGYLIRVGGKTIYHAGDTDFIPEMRQLKDVDLALLPTGDKYTMDNAEAAEAAATLRPKVVMAMHTWKTDREEFKRKVDAIPGIKAVLLKEGEEYQLR